MKRYFEVVGKKQTLMLDLKPPASAATVQELSAQLNMELRELRRDEYALLRKDGM